MGCSPPDWWYERQHRASIEEARIKHQREVGKLLRLVEGMTPDQRADLRRMLDGEEAQQ